MRKNWMIAAGVVIGGMMCASLAYSATLSVTVKADKQYYSEGETAVFNVELKDGNSWAKEAGLTLRASFPDPATPVSLVFVSIGHYKFEPKLGKTPKDQALNVEVYQGKKTTRPAATAAANITVFPVVDSTFTVKEGSHTNHTDITLQISSDADHELMVSEAAGFDDAVWQPYAASLAYVLSNGDGVKTVYMKFRHLFLNTEETEQRTINLDTVSPAVTIMSPSEGAAITGKTQQ
ncbi:MAG: hypothetical protein PHO30_00100 [Candidatus Omnitrophica bacterium]|nr:hypothetical protein [Candidatus Omnitrophota bacterium]